MLKIRRSHDRLIFNMGMPIPGKDGLYIEMGHPSEMHLKLKPREISSDQQLWFMCPVVLSTLVCNGRA